MDSIDKSYAADPTVGALESRISQGPAPEQTLTLAAASTGDETERILAKVDALNKEKDDLVASFQKYAAQVQEELNSRAKTTNETLQAVDVQIYELHGALKYISGEI